MADSLEIDGNEIRVHLAAPSRLQLSAQPGVVLMHGFPRTAHLRGRFAATLPSLADRIAAEIGFPSAAFSARGVDDSGGDFSIKGWMSDLRAVAIHLQERTGCEGFVLVGFGVGGALVLTLAGEFEQVRAVATASAPTDLKQWSRDPRKFVNLCREVGVISDPEFPKSLDAWGKELAAVNVLESVEGLSEVELLVLHGTDDEIVPVSQARMIVESHGTPAMRLVTGAGHELRNDPRAMALLLGWLERQKSRVV